MSLSIKHYLRLNSSKVILDDNVIAENSHALDNDFLKAIYRKYKLDYPKFYKMDTLCKAGFLTAEILLKKCGISPSEKENMAMLLFNASSTIDIDTKYLASVVEKASPALFVYTLPNILLGEISIRHKIYGESLFFIDKHIPTNVLLSAVDDLFKNRGVNHCLAGYTEVDDKGIYESCLLMISNENSQSAFCTFAGENLNKILNRTYT